MNNATTTDMLLVQEVTTLYNGERFIRNMLENMNNDGLSDVLKQFLLRETKVKDYQLERLEKISRMLGIPLNEGDDEGILFMYRQRETVLRKCKNHQMCEAIIVIFHRAFKSMQINAYRTARAWAEELGEKKLSGLLKDCIREEKKWEYKLNEIEENISRNLTPGNGNHTFTNSKNRS